MSRAYPQDWCSKCRKQLVETLRQIETRCHTETRQELLAIVQNALTKIGADK